MLIYNSNDLPLIPLILGFRSSGLLPAPVSLDVTTGLQDIQSSTVT